ncbi:MAG: dockerin type I domain-containing protein [Bacillota bacterium]|nr:dockerin type I domain-containing protein [Bacillota bacterium]
MIRIKKELSVFVLICVFVMNFNLSFADNTLEQLGSQKLLQKLSVSEATYSQTSSTPTVTEIVYSTLECTPTPITSTTIITPTPTITPTPKVTSTPASVISSVYQETNDYGNTIEKAFALYGNTTVSGNVNNSDLVDVFCYSSYIDVDIIIQISCNNCTLGIVSDKNETQIVSQEYDGSGSFNLSFHAAKDSKYYIKLSSAHQYGSVDYTFKTIMMIDDYSDNLKNAAEIFIGQGITGNFINNSDVDFFKFTPEKTAIYNIYSTNYNFSINLYDEKGSPIEVSQNYTSLNANQTYYLKLSRNNNYFYSDFYTYDFQIKGPIEDDYGNTLETSHKILLDNQVSGELNYYYDSDFFSFRPSTEGIYSIKDFIGKANNSYNPSLSNALSIFDSDNNLIKIYYDNIVGAYFNLSKDKTYYICISNNNYYSLCNYSFSIQGPIIDDNGNTFEDAKKVKLDEKISGNLNYMIDVDYFSMTPSVDGTYCIDDFSMTNSSGNYSDLSSVLTVVDSVYKPIDVCYYNSNKAHFSFFKGTTYYIRITNINLNRLFDYSFSVHGPIKDDAGNTKENAKEIQPDTQIQCSADYYYDVDFFSFKPKVDGYYYIDNFTSDYNNMSLISNMTIYDSYGNGVSVYRLNSKAYFPVLKDENYYISFINNSYYSNTETLNYSYILKEPLTDDYGDTKETATEIQLDDSIKGFAGFSGDKDYFSFKPSVAGIYYIDDFSVATSYYSQYISRMVKVVDSNGNQINVNYDTSTNKKAYFTLKKDTTYYIYITSTDYYAISEYSFTIKGPIEDDYGNSIELAHEIKLNEEVKGSIDYFNDNDYFSFKPSDTGVYYIDCYNKSNIYGSDYYTNIDHSVNIMDANGNSINVSFDNSSIQKAYFSLTKNNIYFIDIKSGDYSTLFNYSILLKGPIIDDYGGTPSYARKIELGKTVTGKFDYPNDCDSFSFTTGAKGYYYISAPGSSNFRFSLYDENYTQVSSSSFTSDTTKPYYYLAANQTYYINISMSYSSSSFSPANYSIYVNGPILDETYGSIVKIGDNNAAINYSGDTDLFKFIPATSGTYYFKLNSNIKISLKISNDNYNSNFQYTVIDENTISAYLNANYIYNITVLNNMDLLAIGDYTLTISDNQDAIANKTFKIAGYVKPDFSDKLSNSIRSGFKISLSGTQFSCVSDENGYFEISGVPGSGTGYDIVITKDKYLKREIRNIVVNDNISMSEAETPIELWAGDLGNYRDESINMLDILQMAKVFNSIKGDSRYLENIDVNNDSVINIEDILIVAKHFNASSKDYEPFVTK